MACSMIIIPNDALIISICQYLVNIGNPNPCLLCRSEPQAFFVLHALLEKMHVFICFFVFFASIWSIFVQYLSIFINVRYLPTIRYCVLYGTAYLPTRTVRNHRAYLCSTEDNRIKLLNYTSMSPEYTMVRIWLCMNTCIYMYICVYIYKHKYKYINISIYIYICRYLVDVDLGPIQQSLKGSLWITFASI